MVYVSWSYKMAEDVTSITTAPVNLFSGEVNPPAGDATVTPSLPSPSTDPVQIKMFLDKVKEILEVYDGKRGNKFDQVVTWREMFNHGITDLKLAGTRYSARPDTALAVAQNASEDYTLPPAPENLVAAGALANVILSWDYPNFISYAYAEIWRSDTNNVGVAVQVGTTTATVYADNIGSTDVVKYYWVRFVNINNVVGPFNAVTGTSATTSKVATTNITDAAITTAKIANLAVDNAKIANLDAAKLTTGFLSADRINAGSIDAKIATIGTAQIADAAILSAKIGDAAVTNAKIGNTIQSSDFSTGTAGWRIQKDGNAELNNATFRGTLNIKSASTGARTEMSNSVIKVFDSSGVLRVKIGDLSA